MNHNYKGDIFYLTKLNMRRSALIDKIDDMLTEARIRFGYGNFYASTVKLRQIQKLLDKELPKKKAKK
jgi:hypothetical protein